MPRASPRSRRSALEGARCEPGLAAAAAQFGLEVAELSDDGLEQKVTGALLLHHGSSLGPPENRPLLLELVELAREFQELQPWEVLSPDQLLEIKVSGALNHTFEACVLSVEGQGGLELHFQPGTWAKLTQVPDEEGRARVHSLLKDLEHAEARQPPPDGMVTAREHRAQLGLDLLGRVDPARDLRAAVGFGRKASETLLDFARPLMAEVMAKKGDHRQLAAELAAGIWNLEVYLRVKDRGDSPPPLEMDLLHLRLIAGRLGVDPSIIPQLQQRKLQSFREDLRFFVQPRVIGSGFAVATSLTDELLRKVRAAGILP